ncbi:hypothetical protein HGRIS_014361 [Hohenbuehelia grisea]|uniref:ferric-chelate reductase (NADPH) n=1 Tax=Hohenbuehelia grisea TaxID=104357 RepID=A0ABR3JU10_9AGAR
MSTDHSGSAAHPAFDILAASGGNATAASRKPWLNDPDFKLFKKRNIEYPWQLWYSLAVFIFIVALFQFVSMVHAKRPRKRAGSEKAHLAGPRQAVALRKLPAAIVNCYRVMAFRWTLDFGGGYTLNMAEVFLTCGYIALLFTWAFINTTTTKGKKFENNYWSNRAGSLAISQFPLITALGTKNNLISMITRVSFDKLNFLHRMIARVVFVLIWVHGAGRLAKGLRPGQWEQTWCWLGVFAAVAFTVLCIISLRPIRAKSYEFFFYTHCALVLMLMVGGYYHATYRKFHWYMVPCFIIWGLDRLTRLIRIVAFNHAYFGFSKGAGTFDAHTELLSDGIIRMTVRRPKHFHWSAGQTAYLTMPGVSTLPFEAHPFTIASLDTNGDDQTASIENAMFPGTNGRRADSKYWKELVFLINPQAGFTRRLANVAARNGAVKVFIDGPYGPAPDLCRFDTSVLVAGGVGVSYALPVFLDIIERVREGKSLCTRILFIWSIRDISHASWVSETLYKALMLAPAGLEIHIKLFVTGHAPDVVSWGDSESMLSKSPISPRSAQAPPLLGLPAVQVNTGRPDLRSILCQEADCTNGRMSVNVCGSRSISNAVKAALSFPVSSVNSVLKGGASVTLHVESFGYA